MARRSAQVIWGRAVRWRRSRTAPLKGRGQRRRDDDDDDDDDSDGGDGRRRGNRAAGRGDADDLRSRTTIGFARACFAVFCYCVTAGRGATTDLYWMLRPGAL